MDASTARRKTSPEEPVHGCHQGWDTASSSHVGEDSQPPLEGLAGFPESTAHTHLLMAAEGGGCHTKQGMLVRQQVNGSQPQELPQCLALGIQPSISSSSTGAHTSRP